MPQNVGSYGARVDMKYTSFFLSAEHIIKEQDPSFDNTYIYNYGHGTFISAGYSKRNGLGIILSGKTIDNMSYRTDPAATLTDLNINFLPALTKSHTYNLAATLYPYATLPQGEGAYQADVFYKLKRGTTLGGKYGTFISINFATSYAPVRHTSLESGINFQDSSRIAYKTGLFEKSNTLYYRDFNIEIKRKLNAKFKLGLKYFHFDFNADVNIVTKEAHGIVSSHIGVMDLTYKINRKHSIRMELQGLWTGKDNKDRGDWATILIEYNISPKFFFAFMDQWSYNHPDPNQRLHYIIGSAGYTMGASNLMGVYGRQKEGIFCIGGVCRAVPATNGLSLTFTSSF